MWQPGKQISKISKTNIKKEGKQHIIIERISQIVELLMELHNLGRTPCERKKPRNNWTACLWTKSANCSGLITKRGEEIEWLWNSREPCCPTISLESPHKEIVGLEMLFTTSMAADTPMPLRGVLTMDVIKFSCDVDLNIHIAQPHGKAYFIKGKMPIRILLGVGQGGRRNLSTCLIWNEWGKIYWDNESIIWHIKRKDAKNTEWNRHFCDVGAKKTRWNAPLHNVQIFSGRNCKKKFWTNLKKIAIRRKMNAAKTDKITNVCVSLDSKNWMYKRKYYEINHEDAVDQKHIRNI